MVPAGPMRKVEDRHSNVLNHSISAASSRVPFRAAVSERSSSLRGPSRVGRGRERAKKHKRSSKEAQKKFELETRAAGSWARRRLPSSRWDQNGPIAHPESHILFTSATCVSIGSIAADIAHVGEVSFSRSLSWLHSYSTGASRGAAGVL